MFFNSYLFIIVFLPLLMVVYYWLSKIIDSYNVAYVVITAASLFFCFYSGYKNGAFIVAEIAFNFLFYAILQKRRSRALLALFITANVIFLGIFKYLDMAITIADAFLKMNLQITNIEAPLGISFITFQQIAFLVYVYKNPEVKIGVLPYSVFVSFFSHVMSGPILFAENFFDNFKKKIGKVDRNNLSAGFLLFTIGLAKKTLLADVYGRMVDAGYNALDAMNLGSALFVSVAYTLQIYFDFSGYCDMAIGIGKMLNIELPINFNSPYKAATIDEFWDRWHMTLTRFLTRYVYIPLGGNRKGLVRTYVNIMLIFLLSGLWHGASLTFVLWGFLHGGAMVFSRIFKSAIVRIPRVISQVITFLFVNFAWIIFRAGTFTTLRGMLRAFIRPGFYLTEELTGAFNKVGVFTVNLGNKPLTMLTFVIIGLVLVFVPKNSNEIVENCKWKWYSAVSAAILLILCVLSFTGTSTYIYLRF